MNFEGKCQTVSVDCRTYDSFNGQCTSCYSGFALASDGKCLKDQIKNGCAALDDNGVCTRCGAGFYLNAGKCIQIDPQCAQFNLATKTCAGCYSGYSLLNGVC